MFISVSHLRHNTKYSWKKYSHKYKHFRPHRKIIAKHIHCCASRNAGEMFGFVSTVGQHTVLSRPLDINARQCCTILPVSVNWSRNCCFQYTPISAFDFQRRRAYASAHRDMISIGYFSGLMPHEISRVGRSSCPVSSQSPFHSPLPARCYQHDRADWYVLIAFFDVPLNYSEDLNWGHVYDDCFRLFSGLW
jgi:hypothetical protein